MKEEALKLADELQALNDAYENKGNERSEETDKVIDLIRKLVAELDKVTKSHVELEKGILAELDKQGEPVGRFYWESVVDGHVMAVPSEGTPHYNNGDFPLYTAPQTKPLSDEEIDKLSTKKMNQILMDLLMPDVGNDRKIDWNMGCTKQHLINFARAIEERILGK